MNEESNKEIKDIGPIKMAAGMDARGIFQEIECPLCLQAFRIYGHIKPRYYTEEEMAQKSEWKFGEFEVLNKSLKYDIMPNGKIIFPDINILNVEVGGGLNSTKGYIHLDMDKDIPDLDIWGNMKDMPFQDETVDEFLAIHVLEHIWWEDLFWTFGEINRIMKMGGIVTIEVPDFDIVKTRKPQEMYHFNMALYGEFRTEQDFNYYANAPLYLMHHSTFNYETLKWYLEQTGFGDIMRDRGMEKNSRHVWIGPLAIKATKIGNPKPSQKIPCNYWLGVNNDYQFFTKYIEKWG